MSYKAKVYISKLKMKITIKNFFLLTDKTNVLQGQTLVFLINIYIQLHAIVLL